MKVSIFSIFIVTIASSVYAQPFGGILQMSGTDSHVDNQGAFSLLPDDGDFTLELWFRKCAIMPTSFNLLDYRSSTAGPGIEIFYSDFTQAFSITLQGETGWENATYLNVPLSLESMTDGSWKHLAITYENGGQLARAFLNGEFLAEEDSVDFMASSNVFVIGANDLGFTWNFSGEIDELRTSDVIRYSSDFDVISEPFVSDANTTGLWHFDEDAGGVVFSDDTGQLFYGTESATTFHLLANENLEVCPGTFVQLDAAGNFPEYNWNPSTGLSSSTISNPDFVADSDIEYEVSAENGMCSYVDVVSILVGNLDASVTGNTVICEGDSTQLNVCCGTTYSWFPEVEISDAGIANPTFSPTSTTVYTVLVFESELCSDVDTVTVEVNQNPSVTLSSTIDTLCVGATIFPILTANTDSGTEFFWSPVDLIGCQGCSASAVFPIVTTDFSVVVTDPNGCTAETNYTIQVEDCGNNIDKSEEFEVRPYPNPFAEVIFLKSTTPNFEIRIFDSAGKLLLNESGITSIDTSNLVGGMYLLVIVSDSGVKQHSIIKTNGE